MKHQAVTLKVSAANSIERFVRDKGMKFVCSKTELEKLLLETLAACN
jgi:hypothetical protein